MKRSFLPWSVAAAALSLALTGCTGQAPASDGDPQSIKYLIEEPEDAKALAALKKQIAGFEKQSGVTVKVDTLPTDTMRTVLQTQIRSGKGPDVFGWGSGPGYGGALAKAGLVKDLTSAYKKYDWQVFDSAKERVTVDGKLYGVPGELETLGIFYNKDLFAKLGIKEPKSTADLEAAASTIKAAGKIPLAVGDKEGWEGGHLLSMALSSAVGPSGMEALFSGTKSWDSPEVVSALDFWKQLNDKGYLPKSPTSVNYDNSLALYYSQDAAMIPTGSWLVGEIDDNTKFKTGFIPFPAPGGAGIYSAGLGSGPYVSASTTKTDAALKFVDFLASPEHGAWTVENLHTIPPMPLNAANLKVSPLFRQVLNDTAALAAGGAGGAGGFGYNIDVLTTDTFNKTLYDGFQAVLTGQMTTKEVASKLQAAAKK